MRGRTDEDQVPGPQDSRGARTHTWSGGAGAALKGRYAMKPDLEAGRSAATRAWIDAGWGRDQERRTGLRAFTHLHSQHSAMLPFPGMSPQPFKLNLFITSSYFISLTAYITTFRHFLVSCLSKGHTRLYPTYRISGTFKHSA